MGYPSHHSQRYLFGRRKIMAAPSCVSSLFYPHHVALAGRLGNFPDSGSDAAGGLGTVGLLDFSHVAALQHGNLIEVNTGLLGIDEACTGIRSLQASVMVSLLLRELYRATFRRRILFLLAGFLIAFVCNVGRTFFLSWTAATQGIESVPKWHDWAGIIELGICFLALWGC